MELPRRRARSLALAAVALLVVAGLAGCLGGSGGFGDGASGTASPASAPVGDDSAGNLSIHFIHVGQGASVLVVGPTGETLLYDTGDWEDDGEHVLDYLRARNVTRIDYLVTSHADADHIGGHAAVIEYFETEADGVGAVYDPGVAAATRTYERYLDAVEAHDVTLYRAAAGDAIALSGASARVLAPPAEGFAGEDRNENSLALRVARGNVSLLLTGDGGSTAERYLRERYADGLNATILAAGHHGSNSSTGPGLLAASAPRVAVVQSAYDSPYGHPHREVLGRLADRGVPTYWTGVHGTVAFETDGERVAVLTRRGAPTDPRELRTAPGVSPGSEGRLDPRATFRARGEAPASTSGPTRTPDATVVADGGETAGALEVAEVHADARGNDHENLDDEYVVFRNAGDRTLDLSGWTVGDEADHAYEFPADTELGPGETLTLHTGSGTDADGHSYWGADTAVWNNGGDTVFVRTPEGELVTEEAYAS
ncbi:lamin tail domain-containing protein [Halorussus marinus]|uniref:lamin tail domain-containing protein n=1 Tax=Halorussus marinus TaxID=2505976 RepID=UPI00106E27A9|nr:lamin tail domain-containing protein [Halorussus marinus]